MWLNLHFYFFFFISIVFLSFTLFQTRAHTHIQPPFQSLNYWIQSNDQTTIMHWAYGYCVCVCAFQPFVPVAIPSNIVCKLRKRDIRFTIGFICSHSFLHFSSSFFLSLTVSYKSDVVVVKKGQIHIWIDNESLNNKGKNRFSSPSLSSFCESVWV